MLIEISVPKLSMIVLAVGEEGFYPGDSPNAKTINPGEEFAVTCGQDFVKNHSPPSIDFAATHLWIGKAHFFSSFCFVSSLFSL